MEKDINAVLANAFLEASSKAPADFCLTCANFEPGIQGGCFLRLKPKLDMGIGGKTPEMLFKPISETQPLSPGVLNVACEGYNLDMGYPDTHPKHGGWICSKCGKYLGCEVADSRLHNLPAEFCQCDCGAEKRLADGFYAV